ncbi:MAG: hypothetical protein JHD16_00790 [Solirubrobacteraceae bacterium]|nr:hypothetical protein [Solirubrobacteraceae bacterium]
MSFPPNRLAGSGHRQQHPSPLGAFLRSATSHQRAGGPIPIDVLRYGIIGSAVVILTGVVALLLPPAPDLSSSGFFLLLGRQVSWIVEFAKHLAVPAIGCGLALLCLDLYLMRAPSGRYSRAFVVGQAVAGGALGALGAVFLALVALNMVLWVVIVTAILVVVVGTLAALLSGE